MRGGLTEVCGLRVGGSLAPLGRKASGTPDLVMEPGRVADVSGLESEGPDSGDGGVTIRRTGQKVFARFQGLADAVLDMDAGTATIDVVTGSPPGMAEVLAGGPVLALALGLRGGRFLHASAVSTAGRAVAFAGPSGGGKSTLAALACFAGADMVSDDTLVLDVAGSEVRCLPGSRELRLRPRTAELLEGADWPRRTTADGRVAVLVGSEDPPATILTAIVVPVVSGSGAEAVEPLRGVAAIRALLSCSRLITPQLPEHSRSMLELATSLTEHVPVYRVTIRLLTEPTLPEPVRTVLDRHLGPLR